MFVKYPKLDYVPITIVVHILHEYYSSRYPPRYTFISLLCLFSVLTFSVLTFSVLGSFLLFVSMRLDAHIRLSSFIRRFIHIHSYRHIVPPKLFYSSTHIT